MRVDAGLDYDPRLASARYRDHTDEADAARKERLAGQPRHIPRPRCGRNTDDPWWPCTLTPGHPGPHINTTAQKAAS